MYKKWSSTWRISLVNVTKFAKNCEFDHIYWRNPSWKTSFFVHCLNIFHAFFYYFHCWPSAGICLFSKTKIPRISPFITNKEKVRTKIMPICALFIQIYLPCFLFKTQQNLFNYNSLKKQPSTMFFLKYVFSKIS